jgi:anti-anti-sigma factor
VHVGDRASSVLGEERVHVDGRFVRRSSRECHALEFIDSSGLIALIRARDAAAEAGVGFHVRDPSPALRRIAALSGLEELLRPVDTIRRAQSGC